MGAHVPLFSSPLPPFRFAPATPRRNAARAVTLLAPTLAAFAAVPPPNGRPNAPPPKPPQVGAGNRPPREWWVRAAGISGNSARRAAKTDGLDRNRLRKNAKITSASQNPQFPAGH
jgi:hypothetical protein